MLREYFYAVTLQRIFVYCITDITIMFKDVHGHPDLTKRLCSYTGVLASAGTGEQSQISFHSTVLSARLNHLNEALQRCATSTGLLGRCNLTCRSQLDVQQLSTADNHSNRRQLQLNKSHAF